MLQLGALLLIVVTLAGCSVWMLIATVLFILCTLVALPSWGVAGLLAVWMGLLGYAGSDSLLFQSANVLGISMLLGWMLRPQLLAMEWQWAVQSAIASLMQSHVTTSEQAMAQAVDVLKQMSGADAVIVYKQVDAVTAEALMCIPKDVLPDPLTTPEVFAEALEQNRCVYHSHYGQTSQPDPVLTAQGAQSVMILPLHHLHDLRAAIVLVWNQPTTFSPHLKQFVESLLDGLGTLLQMQDTTYRLDRLQTRFSAMLETLPQGIVFVDENGEPGWVNQIAADQLHLSQGTVEPTAIATAMAALRMQASNQSEIAAQAAQLFGQAEAKIRDWEWDFDTPAAKVLSLSSTPTHSHTVTGRLWVIDDITERKQAERAIQQARDAAERAKDDLESAYEQLEAANQSLHQLATVDGLTQIANRRTFDEQLRREWQRLSRSHEPLTVILCDIDFFKRYNDGYGHQAGDRCLQQVAQALAQVVNRPADLVARYGGEEFVVILPDTDEAGGIRVAQKIQNNVHALPIAHEYSEVSTRITLSIGVAEMIPRTEVAPATLVESADQALYLAKRQGRDRIIAMSGHIVTAQSAITPTPQEAAHRA
jgi:diguanylate cyclase (GGDEF)-like protein